MLKTNQDLYDVGSMVRNAQIFGAGMNTISLFSVGFLLMEKNDRGFEQRCWKCNCDHAWLTAAAVILFPDPNSYILTKKDQLGVLPQDVSPTQNVKFVSGDPSSPFVDSYGKNLTTPGIPVVSISSNQANVILSNLTDAFNVSRSYWYGLALRQNMHRNFTASVEVYQEFKSRCVKGPFMNDVCILSPT